MNMDLCPRDDTSMWMEMTFQASDLKEGMLSYDLDGKITKVYHQFNLSTKFVQEGWIMKKIDGAKWSDKLYKDKLESNGEITLVFDCKNVPECPICYYPRAVILELRCGHYLCNFCYEEMKKSPGDKKKECYCRQFTLMPNYKINVFPHAIEDFEKNLVPDIGKNKNNKILEEMFPFICHSKNEAIVKKWINKLQNRNNLNNLINKKGRSNTKVISPLLSNLSLYSLSLHLAPSIFFIIHPS
jgi:hypothetical protein